MKITICDPCKKQDNKITETLRYMRVKGKAFLRLDICDEHAKQVDKMSMVDYVRFVLLINGMPTDATDEEIKSNYLT